MTKTQQSPKWLAAVALVAIVVALVAVIALATSGGSDDSSTPAATPPAPAEAVDEDLTDIFTLEEFVDTMLIVGDADISEFCQAIDLVGPSAGYQPFAEGFEDAGLEWGYTTREVYDEVMTRC